MLETQAAVLARDAVETLAAPEPAVQRKLSGWTHIALLCAAPFIGLGLLAWHGGRALLKRHKTH